MPNFDRADRVSTVPPTAKTSGSADRPSCARRACSKPALVVLRPRAGVQWRVTRTSALAGAGAYPAMRSCAIVSVLSSIIAYDF